MLFHQRRFFGCPGFCSSICFLISTHVIEGRQEHGPSSVFWIIPPIPTLNRYFSAWISLIFAPGDCRSCVTIRCSSWRAGNETVIFNVLQDCRCSERKWKPMSYIRWKARLCISAILYRASNSTITESDALLYSGRQHSSLKDSWWGLV
jgi:hypothetical protein